MNKNKAKDLTIKAKRKIIYSMTFKASAKDHNVYQKSFRHRSVHGAY